MNSMIENLVIDMRALGIKSLALELDDSGPPAIASPDDRAPLAPDDLPVTTVMPDGTKMTWDPRGELEPEFRGDPNQCAMEGCGEPNGGVLGGKLKQFCRKHAFQRLGVK